MDNTYRCYGYSVSLRKMAVEMVVDLIELWHGHVVDSCVGVIKIWVVSTV